MKLEDAANNNVKVYFRNLMQAHERTIPDNCRECQRNTCEDSTCHRIKKNCAWRELTVPRTYYMLSKKLDENLHKQVCRTVNCN